MVSQSIFLEALGDCVACLRLQLKGVDLWISLRILKSSSLILVRSVTTSVLLSSHWREPIRVWNMSTQVMKFCWLKLLILFEIRNTAYNTLYFFHILYKMLPNIRCRSRSGRREAEACPMWGPAASAMTALLLLLLGVIGGGVLALLPGVVEVEPVNLGLASALTAPPTQGSECCHAAPPRPCHPTLSRQIGAGGGERLTSIYMYKMLLNFKSIFYL